MGLVANEIERQGVPTVTLAMERQVVAPRAAFVPFPYNFPMGEPGDADRHRSVALAALALFGEMDGPGEVELPFRWRGDNGAAGKQNG